jgi:hypothetical protein
MVSVILEVLELKGSYTNAKCNRFPFISASSTFLVELRAGNSLQPGSVPGICCTQAAASYDSLLWCRQSYPACILLHTKCS